MKSFQGWAFAISLVSAGIIVAACSSDATPTTNGSSSGGTSGKSSSGTTDVPSGSGLTGTWDLVSSGKGAQGTGTLSISAETFEVTIDGSHLKYTVSGSSASLTWQAHPNGSTESLTVARTNAAFDTGALPLPLGGSWKVTEATAPGDECTGTIGVDTSAQCTQVELPDVFPDPRKGVIYSGKRTSTATSIFGDLGGDWTFKSSEGEDGCAAKFSGNQVMLTCDSNIGHLAGGVTLTFADDLKSVSGTTSEGVEVAGHKH